VANRITFQRASAKEFPGTYDLVAFFDCLHDMGDPGGVAMHVESAVRSDGTWMIVEPLAGDRIEDNLNPIGRIFYSASTQICVPASLSQEVGTALGAQAGETGLRELIMSGGFSRVRRATATPFCCKRGLERGREATRMVMLSLPLLTWVIGAAVVVILSVVLRAVANDAERLARSRARDSIPAEPANGNTSKEAA
jgi:hypothetical protein